MATTDFLPTREAELVIWSLNFKTRITAAPLPIGLSALQATAYGALHDSFVTAYNAATEEADWTFQGNTPRTSMNVTFPGATPAGAKVWFTAFWFNPRKQSGPAATPLGINLPGGAAMAA